MIIAEHLINRFYVVDIFSKCLLLNDKPSYRITLFSKHLNFMFVSFKASTWLYKLDANKTNQFFARKEKRYGICGDALRI